MKSHDRNYALSLLELHCCHSLLDQVGDSKLFLLAMVYASLGILLSYLMWYRNPLSRNEEREQEREEGGRGRSSSGEATCLLIPTREQLRRLRPARRSSSHSSGEQQWLWTNGCGRMVVNNGCGRMVVNNDCKIWL